jgi:hypothetical protein
LLERSIKLYSSWRNQRGSIQLFSF